MLDVLELEKRWSRYRLKKSMPLLIGTVTLFIIAGATSYLYIAYPDLIKNIVEDKQLVVQKMQPEVEVNTSIDSAPVTTTSVGYEQNVLRPSLNFMYNIEDKVINYNTKVVETASAAEEKEKQQADKVESTPKSTVKTDKETAKVSKPHTKVAKAQKKQPVVKKVVKISEPVKEVVLVTENTIAVEKEPEELFVQIDHKQISDDELNSVIKRFDKQKKPALSLFIAKKYYEQGNYKEAYNYALETNKLNPDIEDSILIFCQSLVKLGNKQEAVTTLQAYLQKSHSVQASILLNEIQTGKFK